MIITKYLIKDAFKVQIATLCILLTIFVSQNLMRNLTHTVKGNIPSDYIFDLLLLKVPSLITFILPLSFFIGILLSQSRLYIQHEMTVLHSVGLSEWYVAKLCLVFSLCNMLIFTFITFYLEPWSQKSTMELWAKIESNTNVSILSEGQFYDLGQNVLFIEKTNDHHLESIFIAQLPDEPQKKINVAMAKQGVITKKNDSEETLILRHGNRYSNFSNQAQVDVTSFGKHILQITPPKPNGRSIIEALTISELKKFSDIKAQALYQWKIAMPFIFPILALIAVPLARVKTRQGKFAKITPAILFYLSYIALLFSTKFALEQKIISMNFGLWGVHILTFVFSLILLSKNRAFGIKLNAFLKRTSQ